MAQPFCKTEHLALSDEGHFKPGGLQAQTLLEAVHQ
jgi:hypothetical protein